ncbi:MAG: hypothetical protein Q8941_06255 [Bacteroidota bacterium]|nr:hypothetical protein [Bacteroidota bacterium]
MMKALFFSIFLLFTAILFGQAPVYNNHAIIVTDLNDDRREDTIFLNSSLDDQSSFNKITVSLAGYQRKTFFAKSAWAVVDSGFLATNKNSIKTTKLFLLKEKKRSVILLFGVLDEGGRDEFSIITIGDNNVQMIFDDGNTIDVEIPITLGDINNDGKIDFVFGQYGEVYEQVDSLNAEIGTYHPYFVYTLDKECRLNKALMKKYNEDHYVFAGFDYSDKIRVLYPRNGGKPKIVK